MRDAIDSEYAGSPLFPLLLTSLIEAADRVDSTTGVQMAYVKQWAPRSSNPLELRVPELLRGPGRAIQGDAVALARRSSGISTWRTSIRRTTSTGISPTTTCGRRWWPGMRPRPTAWPASGWTPVTHPRTRRSTRSGPCRRRWRRWCNPWTATCSCCPTTTSPGSSWRSSRRCAQSRREVATLAFDSTRYVGARIGIFDPSGRKVGRVSHLSNQELLVIAGEAGPGAACGRGGRKHPARDGVPRRSDRRSGSQRRHRRCIRRRSPRAWWIGYNRQREQARSRRPPQRPP